MGGHSLFRTLSEEEIGFDKDATVLLYKSLNPTDQIDGLSKGT
jgi:hypothetical protein